MKVYGNREFQGLKVGVLSKESRSFLSPSGNGQKSTKKGQFWLPLEFVKFIYFMPTIWVAGCSLLRRLTTVTTA